MRMVGVPESHFYPWAAKLINMGYKVGRVDQTETQIQKEKKNANAKPEKNQILERQLTKLYTVGTLVDVGLINGDDAHFLMSIYETHYDKKFYLGICLLDSSTGAFHFTK